ncbi:MAG: ABC transporter permease [Firmicutes bacterium]|nr:ABC transporter permease [Bacillota bacterium]
MAKILTYFLQNQARILTSTWEHFYLFAVSTFLSVVIGIFTGIFVTGEGRERIGRILLTITGAAQAVPSMAVVALVFIFVGIGFAPAVIALVIYSLVPIIFNTTSGLLSISPKLIEAAKGTGLTNLQILWRIKLPIAVPVIMAGIRSAATINIGTATVAAVIGGGGLGDLIYTGLKLQRTEIIIIGTFLAAFIAILVDILIAQAEKVITPKGLKISR